MRKVDPFPNTATGLVVAGLATFVNIPGVAGSELAGSVLNVLIIALVVMNARQLTLTAVFAIKTLFPVRGAITIEELPLWLNALAPQVPQASPTVPEPRDPLELKEADAIERRPDHAELPSRPSDFGRNREEFALLP